MIFDVENSLWKSNILAQPGGTEKLGKASRDAYKREGWLILKDLLRILVAEGVAFEVNNFVIIYLWNAPQGRLI